MQINGITNFTTGITSITQTQNLTSSQNQNDLRDSVSISELGQRLSTIGGSRKLSGGTSDIKAAASLMSKTLSDFEKTLTKMDELTKKASKDNLTALERIDMQIEFEELREDLASASTKLNEGLAKISGKKTPSKIDTSHELENPFSNTNTIKIDRTLLERARDRLMKGEEWDVAEIFNPKYEISDDGHYKITGGTFEKIDDSEEPTVSDKINASDTVNLMSSVTAKKGVERIEYELNDVKHLREQFSSFLMNYNGEDLDGQLQLSDLPQEEQRNKFQTALGIMLEDPDTETFKLIQPTNRMGYMFTKIEGMFNDVAGKLASSMISENITFQNFSPGLKIEFNEDNFLTMQLPDLNE